MQLSQTEQKHPPLIGDIFFILISLTPINKLLTAMLVNKTWYRFALQRWRTLLVEDFSVDPNIANILPHPNLVYYKICLSQKELIATRIGQSDLRYIDFIIKYGLDSFCFCSDVEDLEKFESFFNTNTIPDLIDVAFLGNLPLVRYFAEHLHRDLPHPFFWPTRIPESPAVIRYLRDRGVPIPYRDQSERIRTSHFSDINNVCLYPLNTTTTINYWHLLSTALPRESLALMGSVRLIKQKTPPPQAKGSQDKPINAVYMLILAIRSGSLELVKYLFEDATFLASKELVSLEVSLSNLLLKVACEWGTKGIVQYLVEIKKIQPTNETMKSAVRSGSIGIVTYLRDYLINVMKPPHGEILDMFLYRRDAICSGSIRMLKFIEHEGGNQVSFSKSDLDLAAERLLVVFCFILKSKNPPSPDRHTLRIAMRSNFPFVLNYLSKFRLMPEPHDLDHLLDETTPSNLHRANQLFTLRQTVENRSIEFTEKLISLFSKKDVGENTHYLRDITPHNNSTTFWNKVLSFPCKNVIRRLQSAILFDQQGNPQQWYEKRFFNFRSITGTFYAIVSEGILEGLTEAEWALDFSRLRKNPKRILIEVPKSMFEILLLTPTKHIDYSTSFLKSEQKYLQALRDIKIWLEKGILSQDSPAAIDFYKHWCRIISEVITNNADLAEVIPPKNIQP